MPKKIFPVVLSFALICLAIFCPAAFAEEKSDLAAARREYICALVSLASYNDELDLFVRDTLKSHGFTFSAWQNASEGKNSKIYLVTDDVGNNILAVTGTEDLKDVKSDLRMGRVPFGADKGTVHQGFYEHMCMYFLRKRHAELKDMSLGDFLAQKLTNNPKEKICITGHSLGGATAVLAAAYMVDCGVKPEQLQTITFGAPAVGDDAFALCYGDKINLTRFVMDGDPIHGLLQSVKYGYKQFGEKVPRKCTAFTELLPHSMPCYLDAAMKNYYDLREDTPADAGGGAGGVYVAPFGFELYPKMEADKKYMAKALADVLSHSLPSAKFAPFDYAAKGKDESAASFSKLLADAKKAKAKYLLTENFYGEILRNEKEVCRMTLEETIYDTTGSLVSLQTYSTLTDKMTPLEAAIYLQEKCRENQAK